TVIESIVLWTQAMASSSSSYGVAVKSGLLIQTPGRGLVAVRSRRLPGPLLVRGNRDEHMSGLSSRLVVGGDEVLGPLMVGDDGGQFAGFRFVADLGEPLVVQRVLDEDQHRDQRGHGGHET